VRLPRRKASRVEARRVHAGIRAQAIVKMPKGAAGKMAPHRREHHDGVQEVAPATRFWSKEDCDQQAGEVLRGDKIDRGSRTMQNRWTQKQQMNWWLEAQWMRLLPVARRTRWVLGRWTRQVQAQWTPVQGCGGLCGAPGRRLEARWTPCSSLGAQWTRLLTEIGRDRHAQHGAGGALGAPGHGLEAQWTRACPWLRRGGRAAHGAGGAMDAPAHGN
jgi:hypothetical protein